MAGTSSARYLLAVVIVVAGVGTVAALFVMSRGEAISRENREVVLRELSQLYLPLFGLVVGTLFSGASIAVDQKRMRRTRLLLALILVGAWCLLPAATFTVTGYVEDVISTLLILRPWGDAVVMAVLGFYFARETAA